MNRRRRGRVIVVCGPDGAGKSSLARAIIEDALEADALLTHHRPGILPGRGGDGAPVTEPHKEPPYPWGVSHLKVLYIFLDYVLGWVATILPALRRGRWVVIERGWFDLVVDPRRYRLRPSRLPIVLARALPEPEMAVVLEASPEVLRARKQELSGEELGRQMAEWRRLRPGRDTLRLDATSPMPMLLAQVRTRIARGGDP